MAIRRGKSFRSKRVKRDYSSKNLSNPFFHNRRSPKSDIPEKKINKRKHRKPMAKLWRTVLLSAIPLAVIIWLIFFSSVFNVKKIEVSGLERVSQDSVSAKAQEYINDHDNLVLLDTSELADKVNESFNFDAIKAVKKWPNTVSIKVGERKVAFIWLDSDGQRYLADPEGRIISGFSLSPEEEKDYLSIENKSSNVMASDGKIDIDGDTLSFILDLYGIIRNNYQLENVSIDDEVNKVNVKLKDFPVAYFNIKLDPKAQLDNLMLVKKEAEAKEEGSFAKLKYVDLRYDNLVYYK